MTHARKDHTDIAKDCGSKGGSCEIAGGHSKVTVTLKTLFHGSEWTPDIFKKHL